MGNRGILQGQEIIETMPFGITFQDREGKILRYNKLALEILGLSEEELLGRTSIHPAWSSVKEDGTDFPGEEHPAMQVLKSGKSVRDVVMGVSTPKKKGKTWIRINSEPVLENGSVVSVISYFSDITSSFEAERELNFNRKINSLLLEASKRLNKSGDEDVNETLPYLLREIGSTLGADATYISSFKGTLPQKKLDWTWLKEYPTGQNIRHDFGEVDEIMAWFLRQHGNSPFLQVDAQTKSVSGEWERLLQRQKIGAILIFPILNEKRAVSGCVALCHFDQNYSFAPQVLRALEFFADLLSSFFRRVKSFWNLRERLKELQCTYKVSKVATQETNLDFDFLEAAIPLIPEGFLRPESTHIELFANGRVYQSNPDNKPGGKSYQSELRCPSIGQTYLKATLADGLDFLPEEYDLLDRLADILQTEMQRRSFTRRLEESNARFQFISESESLFYIRVDLKGNLLYASDLYIKQFQWLYEGSPQGKNVAPSICPHHLPKVQKMVDDCIKNPGVISSGEIEKPKEGGGVYHTFWEFKAVPNPSGEITEIICIGLDISSVRSAQKLAQRFKTVSDQSSNGTVLTDFHGKIEYVNKRFCDLSGFKPESILGKSNESIFHRDFLLQRNVLRAKIEKEKRIENEIVKAKLSNGRELEVLLNANLISSEGDAYIYYSVVDISDRLAQERRIKDQNRRLEAILSALPDQVFINDTQGNYLEYFPGFTEEKRNLSFVVGKNIRDVLPSNISQDLLRLTKECIQSKEIKTLTYQKKLQDEDFWLETVITPIDDNKVLRFVRDITIQKEYQEQLLRFNIAVHQSPVGIVITNKEGLIEYVSPSNENISGYKPEDLVGLSSNIFGSGKTPKAVYNAMWAQLNRGETWEGELLNKNKNGEDYWERISITPMKDEDGKVHRFMALKQNIHNERVFKENLMEQNKIFLEISSQQSHDVRGPIARILGLVDHIEESPLDEPKLMEYIEAIGSSAEELDKITRNIVKLSARAGDIDGLNF